MKVAEAMRLLMADPEKLRNAPKELLAKVHEARKIAAEKLLEKLSAEVHKRVTDA